ncbi:hypothetical protein C3V38_15325 [Dietzia sp. oral taxon 368]|nr:hypothetical protein C3V38_15325 [Dietzia sp. oral taxon 368]
MGAKGGSVGAGAALAFEDPIRVDVSAWNPLPAGVSNDPPPVFYALVVMVAAAIGNAGVLSAWCWATGCQSAGEYQGCSGPGAE